MRPVRRVAPIHFTGPLTFTTAKNNKIYTFLKSKGSLTATSSPSASKRKFTVSRANYMTAARETQFRVINNGGASYVTRLNAFLGKSGGGSASLDQIYGLSRSDLIRNFGQYCSYCEMPVFDNSLAVEHMIPKNSFADRGIDYNNFLLSCPNCNSQKSDHPSKDLNYRHLMRWAGSADAKPQSLDQYDQLENTMINYYLWPLYATAYQEYDLDFKFRLDPQAIGDATPWTDGATEASFASMPVLL
ncbi:MAG: HNH endonuclease [Verrucomicrobiota bacterium]